MASHPQAVLDVGCGTGKASRLLQARGCRVLGVEPDPQMAAVARSRGVRVEVSEFETWEPAGRRFDMVVSAQAWHWIDAGRGPAVAARVLPPGGLLAPFWNNVHLEPQTLARLDAVYAERAPALRPTSPALGRGQAAPEDLEDFREIGRCGFFTTPSVDAFSWDAVYSAERWIDYLGTCSDHVLLPPPVRERLLEAIALAMERDLGGGLTVHYRTELWSACRRG